jgi:hypothetical protein
MNTDELIPVTPQVSMTSLRNYLIRIDKEEFGLVQTLEDAILVVDSLATHEVRQQQQKPGVRVFRRDIDNGKSVSVYTQAQGLLVNGAMVKTMLVDVIPVTYAILTTKDEKRAAILRPPTEVTVTEKNNISPAVHLEVPK